MYVYKGFSTICSFRPPLGALEHTQVRWTPAFKLSIGLFNITALYYKTYTKIKEWENVRDLLDLFFFPLGDKVTQTYKAISHKTSCKANLFQYSLSKSLCLKAEVSLIKVLECMRGAKKNDLLVPEKLFLFRHSFSSSFHVEVTGEGDNQTSIDQKWGLLKKWEVQSTEKSNKN